MIRARHRQWWRRLVVTGLARTAGSQVDPARVTEDLVHVVTTTLQPVQITFWARDMS